MYEPGLSAIVSENYAAGRLHFTTSLTEAMRNSEVYFIAVGTPPAKAARAIYNTFSASPRRSAIDPMRPS
jgi:UDPglucose 6-dehydrogenase